MNRYLRFAGLALLGLVFLFMRMRGGGTDEVHPNIVHLTDVNFEQEVSQSSDVVLVDLWAPWCGPCRQIAPLINELAAEEQTGVRIAKLNVDDSPETAQRYSVESIPTLLIFKRGELVERIVGARPKSVLQAAIEKAKG